MVIASTKYEDLRPEYADLWARMVVVRPERANEVDRVARNIMRGTSRYELVSGATGVPWYVIGIIHAMECGLDFSAHLHNGDPLSARTVNEPKGRPSAGAPPYRWEDSAVDALRCDGLDRIRDWSIERIAHALEGYNGWRTRRLQGLPTPYLWSFSEHYERGKYVADDVWDADAVSQQAGAMVLLKRLMEVDDSVRPTSDIDRAARPSPPQKTDPLMSTTSPPSWPLQSACNAFYGDPRGSGGRANPAWEKSNLVLVKAPWPLVLSWEPETRASGIRVHRKCAASLERVLTAIWETFGRDESAIRAAGLHLLGGGYNFRLTRGGNSLSMHSWGCAVDFDPDRNSLGDETPAMDRRVISAFEAEGWEWGGHWRRKDGMHFQAAWTRDPPPRLASGKPPRKSPPLPPEAAPDSKTLPDTHYTDELLSYVQQRLQDLGYTLVGNVDGKWGQRTRDGILAFRADYGLPSVARIDSDLLVALAKGKVRPIDPSRAEASIEQIAAKVPAVKAARAAKLWTWIQSLGAMGLAAGAGIIDNLGAATDKLAPLQAALGSIPLWLILLGVAGVSYVIWRQIGTAEAEAATDYRQARRL